MKPKLFQLFLPLFLSKKRSLLFFVLTFFSCYVKAQMVNSGNLYIAGNVYNNSDFTNNSTASYQNDGFFELTGNFNNDQALMVEGTGTTKFSGAALQKITGSQAADFHDVIWNNSAGVKMFKNVIMGGTISPINGSLYFGSYTLAMGGKISLAYTNTSAFSVTNASDLIINGNAAAGNKIYFDPSANTIHDVTINSSGTGALGNALNITAGSSFGTVTANGSFDAAGFLTLKSDANGTARVSNSSGTISNYVTVERYIPPRRAWRFMAVPTNNDTLTIRSAWQEGANNHDLVYANHQDPHPGYGTDITYDNDWTKGFDVNTTYNPSIKVWNQSGSNWDPAAPPTVSTLLKAYPAYCLFVRGSRAVNLALATYAPTDPTIIRETGTLNNGTYTKNITANTGDYLFVGNPFASSIAITGITGVLSTSTGIYTDKYYVWDPALNGSYGVGGYITYDAGIMVPPVSGYPSGIIQGEQAFMVQASAANPSLVFNQNCKIATEANVFARPAKNPVLYVNLMLRSADSLLLVDGTAALFGPNYSTAIDGDDAIKFPNFNESIAMLRYDRRMAIETRPFPVLTDTLFLKMTYLASQPYVLSVQPVNSPDGTQAWLVDKYLNSKTLLKQTDTTLYDFTANYYDTTTYMRRFMIIYRKSFIATPVSVKRSEAVAKTLNGSVNITPNPVTASTFEINLVNVPKGNYKANVYTNNGQVLLTRHIEHSGGTFSYKTNLPPGIAAGIYTVSIVNSDNKLIQKVSLVVSKN